MHIYYSKSLLFRLVAFKKYAIIETVYCFNLLPWKSARNSHWDMFLEINLNQKRLKLYTYWVRWKKQYKLAIRKHALLWNTHEYLNIWISEYSDSILVKNSFNPFHHTGLFLCTLKYIRKPGVYWCFLGTCKKNSIIKWGYFVTNISDWR